MGGRRTQRATTSSESKKKELSRNKSDAAQERLDKYKSSMDQEPARFVPPELLFAEPIGFADDDLAADLQQASAWDIAVRYHEFKSRKRVDPEITRELRRLSADAVIERAQELLGSAVRPMRTGIAPIDALPALAEHVDFDVETTIEESPLLKHPEIWMSYGEPRPQPIVLCVDTSLSMTGEKLALTAVALAVVLLEFPEDPIGIVAFENAAQDLKLPGEKLTIHQLVERFLDVPAQGYTHLEDGMRRALVLAEEARRLGDGRPCSMVLLTDGKYTAGRDPSYLASRFHHLVLLKMGQERGSMELCRELARLGHGSLQEVGELEALPQVMYSVVKDLLRGR